MGDDATTINAGTTLKMHAVLDMRKEPKSCEVPDHEAYYIVHRILSNGSTWLHQGAALCDSPDGLPLCVDQIKNGIHAGLGVAAKRAVIESIFIRNLTYSAPDIREAMSKFGLAAQLSALLEDSVQENFAIIGKIGNDQLTVMAVTASSAAHAVEIMSRCVAEQHGKSFLPLSICIVGTAANELDRMFEKAAAQIQQLLDLTCSATPH